MLIVLWPEMLSGLLLVQSSLRHRCSHAPGKGSRATLPVWYPLCPALKP
jgi:hypothetical protein